jgi:hypothetical protein
VFLFYGVGGVLPGHQQVVEYIVRDFHWAHGVVATNN